MGPDEKLARDLVHGIDAIANALVRAKSTEQPQTPTSLRAGPEVKCLEASPSDIPSACKEIYFRTVTGNIYCIAPADDGRLACFNARDGTGTYLSNSDLSSKVRVGHSTVFSDLNTTSVTEIHRASDDVTAIKLEFLAARGKLKG